MEFSESHQAWGPVPEWVQFLISFGYQWPTDGTRSRRIGLISMPCDSAAAALIALGAMIRGLTSSKANDFDGHYEALVRYARQYLENCRVCEMRCHPEITHCGYKSEVTGQVRYQGRRIYTISERSNLNAGQIWLAGQGINQWVNQWLNPRFSTHWQIDGIPVPQLLDGEGGLPEHIYRAFISDAPIIESNLVSSFSGVSLAGRVAGKSASRDTYASLRFRIEGQEFNLADLLSIHTWSNSGISRMTFFNSRTEEMDREPYAPSLVIADGDAAFLKVLDRLQHSDVIGIIHRIIDRSNLEAVANRMIAYQQWYVEDNDLLNRLADVPKGLSVTIIRRKNR